MHRLVLKDLPKYECLMEASKRYPDLDPSACEAFMHLIRAGDDVFKVMNAHFAAHHITQGRFLVLMLLLDKGTDCPRPSTPAELADMASVSRATITGLLDTLERDGFIRRDPDPDDRRMMSVRLTPEGEAFMNGVLPAHFRLIRQLMGGLTEHDRKTLVRLLNKIVEQAAAICGSPAPAPSACGLPAPSSADSARLSS